MGSPGLGQVGDQNVDPCTGSRGVDPMDGYPAVMLCRGSPGGEPLERSSAAGFLGVPVEASPGGVFWRVSAGGVPLWAVPARDALLVVRCGSTPVGSPPWSSPNREPL